MSLVQDFMTLFGAIATAIWPKFSEFREALEEIRAEDMGQVRDLEARMVILEKQNSKLLELLKRFMNGPQRQEGSADVPDYIG